MRLKIVSIIGFTMVQQLMSCIVTVSESCICQYFEFDFVSSTLSQQIKFLNMAAARIRLNRHILFIDDEEYAVPQPKVNSKKRIRNPQNHKKTIASTNYNKVLVKKRPNETRPRRPRGEFS